MPVRQQIAMSRESAFLQRGALCEPPRKRACAGANRGLTSESTQPRPWPHVADRRHPTCSLIPLPLANSISISIASGTSGSNLLCSSSESQTLGPSRCRCTGPRVLCELANSFRGSAAEPRRRAKGRGSIFVRCDRPDRSCRRNSLPIQIPRPLAVRSTPGQRWCRR
jgi:hypothetical protein